MMLTLGYRYFPADEQPGQLVPVSRCETTLLKEGGEKSDWKI